MAMKLPEIGISRSSPVSALTSAAWPSAPLSPGTNAVTLYGVRNSMFGLGAGAVEHDLGGAKLVPAMHDRDVRGELGEEDRLLHRGVAAADDDRRGVAEEGRVTGGAVADAAAGKLLLAADPELLVLGAHRQHDRAGAMLDVIDPHAVYAAGLVGQLDAVRLGGEQPCAETLGLVAELLHHLGAHDPFGEPGIVLDVGRLLQQPTPGVPLDHERVEVGAGRVERGRVASGAAADDDHALDVAHLISQSYTLLFIV